MVKNSTRGKAKPALIKKKKEGPKKPKSGFMFFSQERRISLKVQRPELKITDASKVIGHEWKALTATEKEPYAKLAAADKERYLQEKNNFHKKKEETKQEEALEQLNPEQQDKIEEEKYQENSMQEDQIEAEAQVSESQEEDF